MCVLDWLQVVAELRRNMMQSWRFRNSRRNVKNFDFVREGNCLSWFVDDVVMFNFGLDFINCNNVFCVVFNCCMNFWVEYWFW